MPDSIAVHHGADDNASGVASIMEIAAKLAKNKKSLKRSVVIIAFSAEEIGLLGSKFFTNNPLVDLKSIKAMVNIDMVGRLKESRELLVGGVGTAVESEDLLTSLLNKRNLKLEFSYNGFGPSDHSSFYIENIPVFFFTTGAHSDYHTPLDVTEKINFEGLQLLDEYIYDLTTNLLNRPKDLTFKEAGPKGNVAGSRGSKVKLGIMPSFGESDNTGLKIDAVTPNGPASLAGLMKDDIITAIEGGAVHNIYEYMARMGKLKP
jgi:acetylornithine deacetylase/succinyl-diaminopimelate desuccinylase-like protein